MKQEKSQTQVACADDASSPSVEAHREQEVRLPTLQRNALSKQFDRPEFTPQEVFALGYRRLQRAEGIGHKGLKAIIEWLAHYGYELRPPAEPADPPLALPDDVRRSINGAVRLLRHHGYRVQRTRDQRTD